MWIAFFDNGPLLFCGHCWTHKYGKHIALKYRTAYIGASNRYAIPRQA